MLSLRPCHFSRTGFWNKICIINMPVFFMCDHEIHIRMWPFILSMATTIVRSTFFWYCVCI
jgi:hypothetical protein